MGWNEYFSILYSWYGYTEALGQDDTIIDVYNNQREPGTYKMSHTDPWCHATISAAAYKSGNQGRVPNTAYCPTGINWFKARNLWTGRYDTVYAPAVRDIIYYDWGGDQVSDHVGTIIGVNGNTLQVREGNKNDMLTDRYISKWNTTIMGYGRPSWGGSTPPAGDAAAVNKSWLQRGDKGSKVKKLQTKLIALGYSCGAGGADGDFGAETEKAVRAFQKAAGINVDGQAGEITMAKLNNQNYNTPGSSLGNWTARLQAECNAQGLSKQVVDGIPGINTLKGCPIVRLGGKGNITRLLQEKLNALGYNCGVVDGIFGQNTQTAVIAFQKTKGVASDGVVGKMTWSKLLGLN